VRELCDIVNPISFLRMFDGSGKLSIQFHSSVSYVSFSSLNKNSNSIRVINLLDLKGVSNKYWALE